MILLGKDLTTQSEYPVRALVVATDWPELQMGLAQSPFDGGNNLINVVVGLKIMSLF